MTTRSKLLTIFEGVDGAGKTTIAKAYAKETGALYVHFPALKAVGDLLPRLYVEAMLPALLGYQDVVWDRSWLSEPVYGTVFRGGRDRVGPYHKRMLERLALRCGAVVVHCDPGWLQVRESYLARRGEEMLTDVGQVEDAWRLYRRLETDLPVVAYDYATHDLAYVLEQSHLTGSLSHQLKYGSAGTLGAPIALVGDKYAERKDCDPWYQWPFASFSGGGCSQWLAAQLRAHEVPESSLLWLNKQDVELLHQEQPQVVIALGAEAYSELYRHKITALSAPHPQNWKRFHHNEAYELMELIANHLRSSPKEA